MQTKFLINKYSKWYFNIVASAQLRVLTKDSYAETHHIIPKSLGGNNKKDNLVKLTAREHFICHWLLTKMTKGSDKAKMAYACKRMMHSCNSSQQRYRITSVIYEKLKQNLNQLLKNRVFTIEWKQNLKDSARKRADNESAEAKAIKAATITKTNIARTGIKKPNQSGKNNVFTRDDVKEKLRQTNIAKYGYANPALVPYTCEHCGKSGKGLAGYKTYHGNNCKVLNYAKT